MFIEKLNFTANVDLMNLDYEQILTQSQWGAENQIGLTHRPEATGNLWKDCVGSLWDYTTNSRAENEETFTEMNPAIPSYLVSKLTELASIEKFRLGRVRLMRLLPKTGLSVHADNSIRYHFVLDTNLHSFISYIPDNSGNIKTIGFHLPRDGHFYKVDTRLEHYVYNGGRTPRIHLVICPLTML